MCPITSSQVFVMFLQFCFLYTQQFRLFEHFYTIVRKLIYELLKNAHSLIAWGVGRQPNCLQIYDFQETHAFQSKVLRFAQRLYSQLTVTCCSYACRAYDWHVHLVLKSHKLSLKNPDSFPSCNILYMILIIPRQYLIDGQIIRI
jgi:hypothetical protein